MQSRSSYLNLSRGRHHLRHWGNESAPLVLMLHGWLDVSATFQLLVEALPPHWHFVAPDWRGYGQSEWHHRPYWLAEFIADLDELVNHLSPEAPVTIVGHSMGGNIASLWAAARPARLERLALIESFGHPPCAEQNPRPLYSRWLDDAQGAKPFPVHANLEAFAGRLRRGNPRLSAENALRIAGWSTRAAPEGGLVLDADPWHRSVINHLIIPAEHFLAAWESIRVPALWVTGEDSDTLHRFGEMAGGIAAIEERLHHLPQLQSHRLSNAGHNLHHEQPALLAALLAPFLGH